MATQNRATTQNCSQNRFYGSLPSGPSYNNSSNSVECQPAFGLENVSQELRDQRRTINYLQDQMDQVIALNDSTVRYEPVLRNCYQNEQILRTLSELKQSFEEFCKENKDNNSDTLCKIASKCPKEVSVSHDLVLYSVFVSAEIVTIKVLHSAWGEFFNPEVKGAV